MISFIVPAHNEERLLNRTLGAIHAGGLALAEPYELIVVDDSSSDRTAAIAVAAGATVVPVRYRQIARTRNAGARAARGDTLIFVDADTLVSEAILRATRAALEAGAVGGGARIRFDGRLPRWATLTQPLFDRLMRIGRMAAGCYFFCTRAAFEAAGGFDERLYALEEVALSRALGRHGRLVILDEAVSTSGRKLRLHSGWDALRLLAEFVRRGPALLHSRDGLSLWYGERELDPDDPLER